MKSLQQPQWQILSEKLNSDTCISAIEIIWALMKNVSLGVNTFDNQK